MRVTYTACVHVHAATQAEADQRVEKFIDQAADLIPDVGIELEESEPEVDEEG